MNNSNTTVSKEWASRTPDERFTSIDSMREYLTNRVANELDYTGNLNELQIISEELSPKVETQFGKASFTNWSLSQLCNKVSAPLSYLNKLPVGLFREALNYGIDSHGSDDMSMLISSNSLRAVTSSSYKRLYDLEVLEAVREIAGNGIGDTNWKVPGTLDWATMVHNPYTEINKNTTTLYAGDRDMFLFLVDDTHPIEVGKLPDGNPDLMFRGFYVWNSEVGSKTVGVSTMYFRAVCQNRIIWGQKDFKQLKFKHTKNVPLRFADSIMPMLHKFTESSTSQIDDLVKAAKAKVIKKEKREEFLLGWKFSEAQVLNIFDHHLVETGRPAENLWDFSQAVSGYAKLIDFQDKRIDMELVAGKMLDLAVA